MADLCLHYVLLSPYSYVVIYFSCWPEQSNLWMGGQSNRILQRQAKREGCSYLGNVASFAFCRDEISSLYKHMTSTFILVQVPSLNDVPLHYLKPNSLVKFRCLIQDMFDPEFYMGVYETVDPSTKTKVSPVPSPHPLVFSLHALCIQ